MSKQVWRLAGVFIAIALLGQGCPILPSQTTEEPISPEPPLANLPVLPPVGAEPDISLSFNHVQPGVYSEVYLQVTGPSGDAVTCDLLGPGIRAHGTNKGTLPSSGVLSFTTQINMFGTYQADCDIGGQDVTEKINVK